MRRLGLVLLLLWWVLPARAQLTVEILQDQDTFLRGERIPLAVRITNRSGQNLRLGDDPDWLTFTVQGTDGAAVTQLDDVPVVGGFDLETSKMATKRLNLAPYYAFPRPNRYIVTAVVKIKAWNRAIPSAPKAFTIIEGAQLWQQAFGVPQTGQSNGPPEMRKYILQQATYLKGPLRLYLRVTDVNGGKTFRVAVIGPMVSFGRPEPQVDPENNLHLLYQNGPSTFSYTVHNPDGDLLLRQTYEFGPNKPRLRMSLEDKVVVSGGERREAASDFPPPKPEEETKPQPEEPADAGTNNVEQTSTATNAPAAK